MFSSRRDPPTLRLDQGAQQSRGDDGDTVFRNDHLTVAVVDGERWGVQLLRPLRGRTAHPINQIYRGGGEVEPKEPRKSDFGTASIQSAWLRHYRRTRSTPFISRETLRRERTNTEETIPILSLDGQAAVKAVVTRASMRVDRVVAGRLCALLTRMEV